MKIWTLTRLLPFAILRITRLLRELTRSLRGFTDNRIILPLCIDYFTPLCLYILQNRKKQKGAEYETTESNHSKQSAGDHEGSGTGRGGCETGIRGQNGRTVHPHPRNHSGASRQ